MRSDHFGIVRLRHSLAYGSDFGFGYGWLPMFVQHAIVGAWNHLSCRLLGHEVYDIEEDGELPFCANCCKRFPEDA